MYPFSSLRLEYGSELLFLHFVWKESKMRKVLEFVELLRFIARCLLIMACILWICILIYCAKGPDSLAYWYVPTIVWVVTVLAAYFNPFLRKIFISPLIR